MRELLVGDHLDQDELTAAPGPKWNGGCLSGQGHRDGRACGLKVPYMQFESDLVFHERFRREEEIGQRLHHPYLIKFFRPRAKSRMYIAMEYGEGTSLRALLQKREPLPVQKALDLAGKITEALVYLHENKSFTGT